MKAALQPGFTTAHGAHPPGMAKASMFGALNGLWGFWRLWMGLQLACVALAALVLHKVAMGNAAVAP